MLTGVPCLYSKWGEYIVKEETKLPTIAHTPPLGIIGTDPRTPSGQAKVGTTDCVWYETDAAVSKTLSRSNKTILKSAKRAPIRERLNDSSKLLPLKFNQPTVGPKEDEDSRELTKPVNGNASQHKVKTKVSLLKRTHSFQPCTTCKQIVQQRKSFSVLSYRPTVHQVQFDALPARRIMNRKQVMPVKVNANGTKYKANNALLLCPEKSTLLQAKERIERVLKMKRQQLQYLMNEDEYLEIPESSLSTLTMSSCENNESTYMTKSQSHTLGSLSNMMNRVIRLATYNDSTPTSRLAMPLSPIPNSEEMLSGRSSQDIQSPPTVSGPANQMMILQKSRPNERGFVSWLEVGSFILRPYQVEIIETFTHCVGISHWRLQYLVHKAASSLCSGCWVKIESSNFRVMITPSYDAIDLIHFNKVTLARSDDGVWMSKDPDQLMDQLEPIPNVLTPYMQRYK